MEVFFCGLSLFWFGCGKCDQIFCDAESGRFMMVVVELCGRMYVGMFLCDVSIGSWLSCSRMLYLRGGRPVGLACLK